MTNNQMQGIKPCYFLPAEKSKSVKVKLGWPSGQMVETGNARPPPLLPYPHDLIFLSCFSCPFSFFFFPPAPLPPSPLRSPASPCSLRSQAPPKI